MKLFALAFVASAAASSLRLRGDAPVADTSDIFDTLMNDLSTYTDQTGTAAATDKPMGDKEDQELALSNIFGDVDSNVVAQVKPHMKTASGTPVVVTNGGHSAADTTNIVTTAEHSTPPEEMPPCIATCPPKGPPSCDEAHVWLSSTGCAASCDNDLADQLLSGICDSDPNDPNVDHHAHRNQQSAVTKIEQGVTKIQAGLTQMKKGSVKVGAKGFQHVRPSAPRGPATPTPETAMTGGAEPMTEGEELQQEYKEQQSAKAMTGGEEEDIHQAMTGGEEEEYHEAMTGGEEEPHRVEKGHHGSYDQIEEEGESAAMTGGEEEEIHQAMTGGEEEEYHEAMTGGEEEEYHEAMTGGEEEEYHDAMTGGEEEKYHEAMTGGDEEEYHDAMTGGEEEEYHEAMTGGEAQLWVMKFKTTLSGVEPEEFNTNPNMIQAFKATIVQMLVDVDLNDIYDVEAIASDTHMRRRLLAANEATVSYKVRATSKAQATQAKTDMVKGNDAFSNILNTEMFKHDVPLVSPMRATTSDNIVVEEESQEEVVEEMKESNEYHQEMTGGEEEVHQGMTGGDMTGGGMTGGGMTVSDVTGGDMMGGEEINVDTVIINAKHAVVNSDSVEINHSQGGGEGSHAPEPHCTDSCPHAPADCQSAKEMLGATGCASACDEEFADYALSHYCDEFQHNDIHEEEDNYRGPSGPAQDNNDYACVDTCPHEPPSCEVATEWLTTGCASTCAQEIADEIEHHFCDEGGNNDIHDEHPPVAQSAAPPASPPPALHAVSDGLRTAFLQMPGMSKIKQGVTKVQAGVTQMEQGPGGMKGGMKGGMGMPGTWGMTGGMTGMTGGEEHHQQHPQHHQHMHESPPTAEQVYDDAKDDEMDDKIAKFEATAVCTSVDDCVEGCKSFTATDDDVQEGVCEMPGLFVCGDDNLCDVHVPDHGDMPSFRAVKVRVGKGPVSSWREANPGMLSVNGINELWD